MAQISTMRVSVEVHLVIFEELDIRIPQISSEPSEVSVLTQSLFLKFNYILTPQCDWSATTWLIVFRIS